MRAHLAIAVGVFAAACGTSTAPEVSLSSSVNSDLTRSECGAFVSQSGNRIDVAPTGADDTRNLQCAIDAAVASGRSASIRLSGGTFHTAQIVAKNFVGQIAGSGTAETVITTLGTPMFVTRDDFFSHGLPTPPGGENPWPSLISFIGGDFSISDLTIRVLDPAPTTGWTVFGLDQFFGLFKTLAGEIYVVGLSAHAAFERIAFVGKNTPSDPLFGNNVYNAIFFVGEGSGPAPLTGSLEVRQSAFLEVAAGAVAINLQDAAVAIIGNTSQRTSWPVQISDLNRTRVTVAANRFQDGLAGIQIFDSCAPGEALCGFSDTQLLVVGNRLTEFDGIEINMATFRDGVSCTVVGNDIHYDAANGGVAVLLGPGTKDCRVVTKGAVKDQGTGNRVTILP